MIFGNIFGSTKIMKSVSVKKFQVLISSGSSCPFPSSHTQAFKIQRAQVKRKQHILPPLKLTVAIQVF